MANDKNFLNLDDLDAEANLAPYVVRLGGKKLEVPNFGLMSGDQAERFETPDARREVLVEFLGDEVTRQLYALKVGSLNKFLLAWTKQAGVTEGEGVASASS